MSPNVNKLAALLAQAAAELGWEIALDVEPDGHDLVGIVVGSSEYIDNLLGPDAERWVGPQHDTRRH